MKCPSIQTGIINFYKLVPKRSVAFFYRFHVICSNFAQLGTLLDELISFRERHETDQSFVLIENVSISYADQFVGFDSQSTSCSNFICAGKLFGRKGNQQLHVKNVFCFLEKELESLNHFVKIVQHKLCLYTVADTNEKNGSKLTTNLSHNLFKIILHIKVF